MKIKVIILITLFFVAPNVFAKRMVLNTNSAVGYIEVTINGSVCSGDVFWHTASNGANIETRAILVNCVVTTGYKTLKIEFDRSDRPTTQHYVGWFSENQKNIAGYFTDGVYEEPWFAFAM